MDKKQARQSCSEDEADWDVWRCLSLSNFGQNTEAKRDLCEKCETEDHQGNKETSCSVCHDVSSYANQ